MKTLISAALLSLGSALTFGQTLSKPALVSELQMDFGRQTFKMRDLQASPMLYVANLNGVRLAYSRLTTRNQWQFGLQAGTGSFIPPSLGIRAFTFSPEQEQPLWLAPTLYRGHLDLNYRRLIHRTANRTTWLGVGLHETVGYSDGLALSTWAFNNASLRVLYQSQLQLGNRHTLIADASLPVLAAVTRMPYSNVVSGPNRSEAALFFSGTRWATLNRFVNPELGLSYRFELSRRLSLGANYRYSWMRYTEPRLIRTSDHALSGSIIYKFQQQYR